MLADNAHGRIQGDSVDANLLPERNLAQAFCGIVLETLAEVSAWQKPHVQMLDKEIRSFNDGPPEKGVKPRQPMITGERQTPTERTVFATDRNENQHWSWTTLLYTSATATVLLRSSSLYTTRTGRVSSTSHHIAFSMPPASTDRDGVGSDGRERDAHVAYHCHNAFKTDRGVAAATARMPGGYLHAKTTSFSTKPHGPPDCEPPVLERRTSRLSNDTAPKKQVPKKRPERLI